LLEVDQPRIARHLNAFITQTLRPAREMRDIVEGQRVAEKLRQENGRAFDGFHERRSAKHICL